ncbi:dipeptide epimerase [Methylotetracoccus oryzae]|uniref:dipeptide epimerase n=1 Tax=Methylotetracoccus oryzae TaxID=1919059 RepID=UPI00111B5C1D|nr:dipeptide epimerase [Methylotetracoccus oryzae]
MRNCFEIVRTEAQPLDAPLQAPFTIASSRVDSVRNVAIAVHLAGGAVGWGEAPTLPPVTTEDQPMALSAARSVAEWLTGRDAAAWRSISEELNERLPNRASVRAGIEMALLDALARQAGMPLYQWFGGRDRELVTDITIPICPNDEAERLAAEYRARGFSTIKVKIGLDTGEDIARLTAIRRGHPGCRLVMDANEGYTADQALAVLAELRRAGIEPALLEQPVPREDWDGLGRLAREAGVPVAADEACRCPADALRILRGSMAQVINIKMAKCGVVQALEIAALARTAGIGLMIGGMVETRLAMGFSAHFAAGLGGFEWIDLDTPLLLAADPIVRGPKIEGARYRLDPEVPGHGGRLPD